MSQLPYDEKLNIGYLSRLFDNTSNCYKFFWFQAILRKLTEEVARFSYEELVNEMIADAWYMVIEYHLRLGPVGVGKEFRNGFDADFFAKLYFFCLTMTLRNSL